MRTIAIAAVLAIGSRADLAVAQAGRPAGGMVGRRTRRPPAAVRQDVPQGQGAQPAQMSKRTVRSRRRSRHLRGC